MKLHLPLTLRSALMAACAMVASYASAATLMTEDIFLEFHSKSDKSERTVYWYGYDSETQVDLNGSNRTFSYTANGERDVRPQNTYTYWFATGGQFKITDAKDILITNVGINADTPRYVTQTPKNKLYIDVSNSNSFSFTNSRSWYSNEGLLSTAGSVNLTNVDKILLSGNGASLAYRAPFNITKSKEVRIVDNKLYPDKDNSLFVLSDVTFTDIDSLVFSGNDGHIFKGETEGGVNFRNCKTIVFENNNSDTPGGITVHASNENYLYVIVFENVGDVVIRNNSTDRQLFNAGQPKFTNVKSVEFIGNSSKTGEVIGQTLEFEGVTDHIYLNNNVGEINEKSVTEGVLVTDNGNASGDITAKGANMNTVFEMKGNKGTGTYVGLYTGTLTVENFGKVDMSDNLITAPSMREAVGMFRKMTLDGVNEVIIKNNRYVSDTSAVSLIDGDMSLTNFGSLDISNNTVGYSADGKEVIAASAKQLVLGKVNIVGRTEGGLSSKVSITDNKIGGLALGGRTSEHYAMKDLQSLDISRNSGSHTYSIFGRLTLENINNVTLSGNKITIGDSIERYVDAVLSTEGLSLEGGESFVMSNNVTDATGFKNTLYGGALTARLTDKAHTISAKNITISGNKGIGSTVYGGAIYSLQTGPVFSGGGTVSITDNGAQGETMETVQGGAIYIKNGVDTLLEFVDNKSVTLRGNYVTDGSTYVLNSIYTTGNIAFKAGAGQTVESYDSLYSENIININGDAKDETVYSGTVTISGEHAEEDLKKLNAKYSKDDLLASTTATADSFNVYGGTLVIRQAQVVAAEWRGLNAQKEATVKMENATIRAAYSKGSLQGTVTAPTAVFSGVNKIEAPVINASSGTWTFHITAEHLQKSALSIAFVGEKAGKFTTEDQVFHLSYDPATLATGLYKLVDYDSSLGSWSGSDTLTYTDVNSELLSGEDVYFIQKGNVFTLVYDHTYVPPVTPDEPTTPETPGKPESPAQRPATTLTWVAGSGAWADSAGASAGAWKGSVSDLNYYNGDSVMFGTAATVTVADVVRPANVLVKHAEGQVVLTGSDGGQITGATGITKEGAGELVLKLGNAYTGDTVLKAGTLTVGHTAALGLSTVQLQGGVLNLGGLAVNNDVHATGAADITAAQAYVGKLTLDGGTLAGDAINLAQDAELLSGSMSNDLVGKGGLVKLGKGTATLSGVLSNAGGATVSEGVLALHGATLQGSAAVEDGATLSLRELDLQGSISLAAGATLKADSLVLDAGDTLTTDGATIEGEIRLSGGTLETTAAQSLKGDLMLGGGVVKLEDTITVSGSLSSEAQTNVLLDVQKLRRLPNRKMTLFTAAETAELNMEHVYLSQLKDARVDTGVTESDVWVQLNSATLTWATGETEDWGVKEDGGAWEGDVDDKRFYMFDDVIFNNAAEVNIVGEVTPGSITVEGEQDTVFIGAGSIAGDAELVKQGKGVLEIRTDNSHFTGDIHVQEGTLKVGHDNALGSGSVFINGATLDGGSHRISSPVVISGVSRIVNAAGAQDVTFESQASVGGSYTLGSGQRLSIGAQGATFTGSFTFGGGTLALNGGRFDLTGDTHFAPTNGARDAAGSSSTIDLSGWEGLEYGSTYELATFVSSAADVESHFTITGLADEKMQQRASLKYDDGILWLNIKRLGMNSEIVATLSRNQLAAYKALDTIAEEGKADDEMLDFANTVLDLESAAEARAALDSIDGAELATVMTAQIASNMAHLRHLRDNIGSGSSLHADAGVLAYVALYDDYYNLDGDDNGKGLKQTEWGGMVGLERRFGDHLMGLALSAGWSKITPEGSGEKIDGSGKQVDFYVVCNFGKLRSVTTAGIASYSYDARRDVMGVATANVGDMSGYAINMQQEFSYTMYSNARNTFSPFVSIESSINNMDSFTEKGAGQLSLVGESREAWATDVTMGARFIHSFDTNHGRGSVMLQAAAVTAIGDLTADLDVRFVGAPDTGFTVASSTPGRWGYNLSAAFTMPISKSSAIFGSAAATMRSGSQEVNLSAGVRTHF